MQNFRTIGEKEPKQREEILPRLFFSKVSKNGLKPVYSDVKNSKFAGFVRACIG